MARTPEKHVVFDEAVGVPLDVYEAIQSLGPLPGVKVTYVPCDLRSPCLWLFESDVPGLCTMLSLRDVELSHFPLRMQGFEVRTLLAGMGVPREGDYLYLAGRFHRFSSGWGDLRRGQ